MKNKDGPTRALIGRPCLWNNRQSTTASLMLVEAPLAKITDHSKTSQN